MRQNNCNSKNQKPKRGNDVQFVVGSLSSAEAWNLKGNWLDQCDLVELRLDFFSDVESSDFSLKLLESWPQDIPILLTLRHPSEGGKNSAFANNSLRKKILQSEIIKKISYLDLELSQWEDFSDCVEDWKKLGIGLIASNHQFERAFEKSEICSKIARAKDLGADIAKFAWLMKEPEDLAIGCHLLESEKEIPLALMGMGKLGAVSRVLYMQYGSVLTYGYLGEAETAPGQWPSREFLRLLQMQKRFDRANA